MKDYDHLLDKYSGLGWDLFSTRLSPAQWGDRKAAAAFLAQYWLPRQEFEGRWRDHFLRVFEPGGMDVADPQFVQGFVLLAIRGGILFEESDFLALQRCMLSIGDTEFVIVEKPGSAEPDDPPICLKCPVGISWTELCSGNFISAVLLEMTYKEYFVFGDSGHWGKFSATEHARPFDLVGFRPEHESLFCREFATSPEEQRAIAEWLPDSYRSRVRLE